MIKKSNIYTRTGDLGTTALRGGTRVKKNDLRVEAYGTVDELNSYLGVLATSPNLQDDMVKLIIWIQNRLFDLGGYLATDHKGEMDESPGLGQEAISKLEHEIDRMDAELPPLTRFVLPGSSRRSALAHVCRTICRRAELQIVTLSETSWIDPNVLRFINRLSDFLFVFARYNNVMNSCEEIFWEPSK